MMALHIRASSSPLKGSISGNTTEQHLGIYNRTMEKGCGVTSDLAGFVLVVSQRKSARAGELRQMCPFPDDEHRSNEVGR